MAILLISVFTCESTNKTIEETCRKTKYYSLCISILESGPRSAAADPVGLAKIGLEIVVHKANAASGEAIGLYSGAGSEPVAYQLYGICIGVYVVLVTRRLPDAARELCSGKLWEARADVTEGANIVCGQQFVGRSDPLVSLNAQVHDLAEVVADVIGSLD